MKNLKFILYTLIVLFTFSCTQELAEDKELTQETIEAPVSDTLVPISRVYEYPESLLKHNIWLDNPPMNADDACDITVFISPECSGDWQQAARDALGEFNNLVGVGVNFVRVRYEDEADVSIECFEEENCMTGLTGRLPEGLTFEETLEIFRNGRDDNTGPREDRITVMVEGTKDCFCSFWNNGGWLTPGLDDCQREWIMAHELMHVLGFTHNSSNTATHIEGTVISDQNSVVNSGIFINFISENGFCDCEELPLFSEGDKQALEIVYPGDCQEDESGPFLDDNCPCPICPCSVNERCQGGECVPI